VLGDFVLNCRWEDYGADPTIVDLFRWHGSEEVEHRNLAHDVAVYFHNSYPDRMHLARRTWSAAHPGPVAGDEKARC
jgi:predicted metal-dependent hydrolase